MFHLETNMSFQWEKNMNLWSSCFEIEWYGQDHTYGKELSETMSSKIVRNWNYQIQRNTNNNKIFK